MYTVVIKGKPTGPYSLEELKRLEILPDTFVRKPGMDDYKEAHELEEIRQLMGFGVPKSIPQYFASFDQRLMAWAVDYFLIVVIYAVIIATAILIIDQRQTQITVIVVGFALVPLTKFIYSVIADASKMQGTIGKKLMSIKISDVNGARIGLGLSLIRNVAKIISGATFCFGYLYLFMNKKQQCLHDAMAGTLVIKDRLL